MKTKKLLCSFLSIVMALAFVLPVLPGAPTAEAAVGTSYVYDFNSLDTENGKGVTVGSLETPENMPWKWVDAKGKVTNSSTTDYVELGSSGTTSNLLPGDYIRFDVTVPEDGKYSVNLAFGVNSGNCKEVLAYLAPTTAADVDAEHYLIGCTNTQSSHNVSATRMLKAGEYALTVAVKTAYNGYRVQVKPLTLTKTGTYAAEERYTFNLAQASLAGQSVAADIQYGAGTNDDMYWTALADSTATASVTAVSETSVTNGSSSDIHFMRIDRTANPQFFSFKINVPKAGEYNVKSLVTAQLASGFTGTNGGDVGGNYAVIPGDVPFTEYATLFVTPAADLNANKNRFSPAYRADTYDYTGETSNGNDDRVYTETSGVMLEAGENIITLRLDNDVNSTAKKEMLLISHVSLERTGEYKDVYSYDLIGIHNTEETAASATNTLVAGTKYGDDKDSDNMQWYLADNAEYNYTTSSQYSRVAQHGRTYIKEADNEFGLVLNVPKAGKYKVEYIFSDASGVAESVQMYAAPADAEDKKASAYAVFTEIVDCVLGGKNCLPRSAFGTATLTAGDNEIIVTSDKLVSFIGMKLTLLEETAVEPETPKAEIPEDANGNFGNVYAYVKDSKVYFIGGLNNINGSAVGFDVSVAGGESFEMTTDKVYKSFTVTTKDEDITKYAKDFGVDAEDGYIFITETDKLAAGNEVTIKPYIVKDGVKVYHGTLELELTI